MDKVLTFKLYLTDLQSEDVNPKTVNNTVKSVFTNYFSKSGEFSESMKNLVKDFVLVKSEPLEFAEDGIIVKITFKGSSSDQGVLDALEVWGEKTANQVDEILDHELIMSLITTGRSAPTVGPPEENPEAPDTDPTTPGGRRHSRKTRKGRKSKKAQKSRKARKSTRRR
jgi:hypothetical protein